MEWIPSLDMNYESPPPKRTTSWRLTRLKEMGLIGCLNNTGITSENYKRILHMEWMKFGETNPPADMEILIWHKSKGCFVGHVSYGADSQLLFVYLKKENESPDMNILDYTYWCEIPRPTPEVS